MTSVVVVVVSDSGYQNASKYWDEQRYMTNLAIEALGNHSMVEDLKKEFMNIMPKLPDISGKILSVRTFFQTCLKL